MSVEKSDDENLSCHTERCYETCASQEQEYLDEGVEKLREREILVSEDSSPNDDPRKGESFDKRLKQAAEEELIVGDSDDAPLSDEEIVVMLERTSNH